MHHEQRKVHAARQIAFEDRVTDVTAPYRQPLAFPLFEVAPPNDSPPSTAGKHPATRLDLVVEIGKANFIVARQAIAIEPKLSPKLLQVVSPTKTNAGLATFANSITLTPGTVTVDLEPGYMVVHALTEALADEAAIMDMGRRVAALENGGDA